MIPRAKIEALVNAPPVNIEEYLLIPPPPTESICAVSTSLFAPGRTMKDPILYTRIKPKLPILFLAPRGLDICIF